MAVESCIDNQRVRHSNPLRLHRMLLRIDEFTEVIIVKIGDFPLGLEVHQIPTNYNITLPIIIAMLIEVDKYQPNSLRRGRMEAFEKDFSDAFTIFSNRFSDPRVITMNDFISFWNISHLKLIVYLRNEDEEEDEYFQTAFKTLLSEYFIKGNESKKIFCLLSIYFLAFSIDMNGDRNPRFIHVTLQFLNSLNHFLKQNAIHAKQLFIKVIKKIKELFVYTIKLGPRDPLLKKNGDTFIRYPKTIKRLTKDNYSPSITVIKEFLPGLQETIKSYQQAKDKLFKSYKDEKINGYKKHMGFDKNITMRLNHILKSYDSQVSYADDELKNDQQRIIQE